MADVDIIAHATCSPPSEKVACFLSHKNSPNEPSFIADRIKTWLL